MAKKCFSTSGIHYLKTLVKHLNQIRIAKNIMQVFYVAIKEKDVIGIDLMPIYLTVLTQKECLDRSDNSD